VKTSRSGGGAVQGVEHHGVRAAQEAGGEAHLEALLQVAGGVLRLPRAQEGERLLLGRAHLGAHLPLDQRRDPLPLGLGADAAAAGGARRAAGGKRSADCISLSLARARARWSNAFSVAGLGLAQAPTGRYRNPMGEVACLPRLQDARSEPLAPTRSTAAMAGEFGACCCGVSSQSQRNERVMQLLGSWHKTFSREQD
jgi:hypothetical protein